MGRVRAENRVEELPSGNVPTYRQGAQGIAVVRLAACNETRSFGLLFRKL